MPSLHVQPDTDFKLQFVWSLVSHIRAHAGALSWYSIVFGQLCSVDSTPRKQYISHCIEMLAFKVVTWELRQNALRKITKASESCCLHFDFLLL